MKIKSIFFSTIYLFILIVYPSQASAQTEQELTVTITRLDSAFWNAYNKCDTSQFKKFFTNDVEFYHDKGGITLGEPALITSFNKNLCSNSNFRLRREAVPGSVKIFPMQNNGKIYGAVISGEHLFYINETGKPEYLDGDANFTHLWLLKNGEWKMARILSYNHHAASYINKRKEIELPAQQLDQLKGTYKSNQFGNMTIERENKVLILKSNSGSFTLYPMSNTLFFSKKRDLVFEFVKDTAGKPVKMIVMEHGAKADELIFEK
jgi:hypothetical protein